MNSEVLKSLSIPAKHKLLIDEATWVNFEKMTCPRLNKAHRELKLLSVSQLHVKTANIP